MERLSHDTWRALKSRERRRIKSAGQAIRIVYAFVLQRGRKPTLLLALEGTVWRFDDDGRVDYSVPPFDDRRIGLSTPFVADVLPAEQSQTGDRWQPGDAVRAAIERDLWPAGLPDAGTASGIVQVEDCASLRRALSAVGTAGMARTMSRLVTELSLSQPTVERLMSALAVDRQTLLDVVAAEHQPDSTLMH